MFRKPLLFVALSLLPTLPVSAQRTDVVIMRNGNRIIGEVEQMELGLLELSLDDVVGRLRIKWEYVTGLTSDRQLDIELADGSAHFGSLLAPLADGQLRIQTAQGVVDVPMSEVVFIEPIEDTFLTRLDASITGGVSFTKASDVLQFDIGFSGLYRTHESVIDLGFNTILTSGSGSPRTTNTDFRFSYYRLLSGTWFVRGDLGARVSDELGIDFRGTYGGGGGARVVNTTRWNLLLSGLVQGNRELTNDGRTTDNVEAVIDSTLASVRHDTPKIEVRTDVAVFVSLNDPGRYRVDIDGHLSFELGLEGLFWDIGRVYYRYDSEPSLNAVSTTDYGIVSGIRYEF